MTSLQAHNKFFSQYLINFYFVTLVILQGSKHTLKMKSAVSKQAKMCLVQPGYGTGI